MHKSENWIFDEFWLRYVRLIFCQYYLQLNGFSKGALTIYIDQFSEFSDPSLPIGRPFIYWGLFSEVDIADPSLPI